MVILKIKIDRKWGNLGVTSNAVYFHVHLNGDWLSLNV